MKAINIYRLKAIALLAFILFATACFYKRSTVARRATAIPNLPQDIDVDFPVDLENADVDAALLKEAAIVISIPTEQQLYLGHDLTPKDQIGYKVGELHHDPEKAVQQSDPVLIVYLAAGAGVQYGAVVDVLEIIRKKGGTSVGLVAGGKQKGDNSSQSGGDARRFLVDLPLAMDQEDPHTLRPNPLMLVVSISSDLKLHLNNQDGPQEGQPGYGSATTYGSVNDPGALARCLTLLIQKRREERAYRPGFETRTDLTEDERVEKTIYVKAPRSMKYGAVVRVIDAVKGSGAYPIALQTDDLPQ